MNQNIETLTWKEAREEVQKVNPDLTTILDEVDPREQDTFYKMGYSFGSPIFEQGKFFILNKKNKTISCTDQEIQETQEGHKNFFNHTSFPFGLVLNKNVTASIEGAENFISLTVFYPGKFFDLWELFNSEHSLLNKSQWNLYSGTRAIFSTNKLLKIKKNMIT